MAEKLSIVIGIFEQPLGLISTLNELVLMGFAAHSFCVCGSSDSVALSANLMNDQTDPDQDLIALLRNTKSYPSAKGNMSIVGTKGSLLESLRQSIDFSGLVSSDNNGDDSQGTWQKLIEKIKLGCLVLMVQTTETYQLTLASTLFLQRSAHNVQTIEYRPVQSPKKD